MVYLPPVKKQLISLTSDTMATVEAKPITLTTEYLSGSIDHLPSGRINKQYTGIGATTLELTDKSRNSVVVAPTRALAATKATEGIYYLGSEYQGKVSDSIDVIKESVQKGERVKIMVVADTFVRLFYKNEEFFLKNFHLLIDEADSFQSESSYRLILNDCIDIYKLFPAEKRTMISATLQEFIDNEISNEPVWKIENQNHQPLDLSLVHSQGIFEADLADTIKKRLKAEPSKKILVAYNSIDGILKTIAALDLDEDEKVGVLCSNISVGKFPISMQSSLVNGKLEKDVTFMTSAYFVGLDIEDNADVIVAGNCSGDHMILTKSKIIQIIGRVRCKQHQNIFVLKTDKKKKADKRDQERDILKFASDSAARVKKWVSSVEKMSKNNHGAAFTSIEDVLESTKFNDVQLVRIAKGSNDVKINWLAIDYLIQQRLAKNQIYGRVDTSPCFLKDELLKQSSHKIICEEFTLLAEERFKKLRKCKHGENYRELESYLELFCVEDHYYGIIPECPNHLRGVLEELSVTKDIIGECGHIKTLILESFQNNDYRGLKKLADDLRFLRCWFDPGLKSKLEAFTSKTTSPMSKQEARRQIKKIKSEIEKVAVHKVNVSTNKGLNTQIDRLFKFKFHGRNRNNYIITRRKKVADYI